VRDGVGTPLKVEVLVNTELIAEVPEGAVVETASGAEAAAIVTVFVEANERLPAASIT
jgi:hypothetical protein